MERPWPLCRYYSSARESRKTPMDPSVRSFGKHSQVPIPDTSPRTSRSDWVFRLGLFQRTISCRPRHRVFLFALLSVSEFTSPLGSFVVFCATQDCLRCPTAKINLLTHVTSVSTRTHPKTPPRHSPFLPHSLDPPAISSPNTPVSLLPVYSEQEWTLVAVSRQKVFDRDANMTNFISVRKLPEEAPTRFLVSGLYLDLTKTWRL